VAGVCRVILVALVASLTASPAVHAQGDAADRGRQLFTGARQFMNGGPACVACHDDDALGVPGGGTMGPDLTNAATRMGTQGIATALQTLYFPTMAPLFSAHPLTVDERAALAAFFETPTTNPEREPIVTIAIGAAALVLAFLFLAITGFAGRSRVRSVRHAMLARTAAARKAAS
jgi:cytochrome c553